MLDSIRRCGYGNITVNGHDLKQAYTNVSSQGKGLVPASSNQGSRDHILEAEWEFSCLQDQPGGSATAEDPARAQFLSFTINKIDGQAIDGGSGFTASFRQHPDSQLFRIEPELLPVPDSSSTSDWLDQSSESVVSEADNSDDDMRDSAMDSFDAEIAELKELKQEAKRIRIAIKEQKRVIWRHFKTEVRKQLKAAKEEIRKCESVRCAFHTAFHKMRAGFRFMHSKFCQSKKHDAQDGHKSRWQRFWTLTWNRPSSPLAIHSHPSAHKSQTAFSFSGSSTGQTHSHPGKAATLGEKEDWASYRQTNQKSHHYFTHAAFIAAEIMACALIPISLFLFIYYHCSHSRRAERRWQRESRRTARVVNNARRRRAFRRWWKNLGRDPRITDYEEKRALVLEQERVLECAMQREIRDLRAAADAVSSMVSGEDDRSIDRSPAGPNIPSQHVMNRGDSLPDYRSEASYGEPPPVYEEDNNDGASLSGVVVDGFQYGGSLGTHYAQASTPRSSVFGSNDGSVYSSDEEATGAKD